MKYGVIGCTTKLSSLVCDMPHESALPVQLSEFAFVAISSFFN